MTNSSFLLLVFVFILHESQTVGNDIMKGAFGPYIEDFTSFNFCQGPKKRNASEAFAVLYTGKNGSYFLKGNLTLFRNVAGVHFIYKIYKLKNGRYEHALDMNRRKPCDTSDTDVAGIQSYVHMDTKSCTFLKGTKSFELDLTKMHYLAFAGNQFYGSYSLRFKAYNSKFNVLCVRFQNTIRPKPPSS